MMGLEEYYDKLRHHDWYYAYSDDHRVWSRGNENAQRLRDIADTHGPEYKRLYEEYRASVHDGKPKPERPGEPITIER